MPLHIYLLLAVIIIVFILLVISVYQNIHEVKIFNNLKKSLKTNGNRNR